MMPRVTVLMPVYNGERYLREAMESVLGQTFSDFEFLIVDDGSTDSTAGIIRSFNDGRIRLLQNPERLKLSGALNRGLDEARGEYVARMDADDISLPQRLEVQTAFMDRHKGMGLCGSWVKMFGSGRETRYKAPVGYESVRAKALFDNPFVHPSVMIRKNLFARHRLRFDGHYYPTEDFELWARAVQLFPCDNIDAVLLRYRIHPGSMTRSDWSRMDAKSLIIVGRELKALGLDPSAEQLLFHRHIGREMSYQCQDRAEIIRAEGWLHDLAEVNRGKRRYDEEALKGVISDTWFRLCFNSSGLGFWIVKKYLSSPLAVKGQGSGLRKALVGAAVVKAMIARSPDRAAQSG